VINCWTTNVITGFRQVFTFILYVTFLSHFNSLTGRKLYTLLSNLKMVRLSLRLTEHHATKTYGAVEVDSTYS